jgi:hypothetical protein
LLAPPRRGGEGSDSGGWVSNSFAFPASIIPVPASVPVVAGSSGFQLTLPAWGVVAVEVRLDGEGLAVA